MNNPWGVQLKKTGFTEKRQSLEEEAKVEIEKKQREFKEIEKQNKEKKYCYEEQQVKSKKMILNHDYSLSPNIFSLDT